MVRSMWVSSRSTYSKPSWHGDGPDQVSRLDDPLVQELVAEAMPRCRLLLEDPGQRGVVDQSELDQHLAEARAGPNFS